MARAIDIRIARGGIEGSLTKGIRGDRAILTTGAHTWYGDLLLPERACPNIVAIEDIDVAIFIDRGYKGRPMRIGEENGRSIEISIANGDISDRQGPPGFRGKRFGIQGEDSLRKPL